MKERADWQTDSELEVFSGSGKRWYNGVVYKVNGDILTVQYVVKSNEIKQKELNRWNANLRPHTFWPKGSSLEVYSLSGRKWYKGVVYKVNGNILTVQYRMKGQIYQKDL